MRPLLLGLLAAGFTACKHDDDHHHGNDTQATITLASPTAGQQFQPGDTVTITGTVVTEESMHGYILYIRRKPQLDTLYSYSGHEHGTSAAISQKWVNTASQTDLELEVKVTLDHDGNTASKKVIFRTN